MKQFCVSCKSYSKTAEVSKLVTYYGSTKGRKKILHRNGVTYVVVYAKYFVNKGIHGYMYYADIYI